MSDGQILTFLVLGLVLLAAGMTYVAYQMTLSLRKLEAPAPRVAPAGAEEPVEAPEGNPDALPFDPARPPKRMVYRPSPSKALPTPKCHCHGEPLRSGQTVLLWPVDDAGGFKIVCKVSKD